MAEKSDLPENQSNYVEEQTGGIDRLNLSDDEEKQDKNIIDDDFIDEVALKDAEIELTPADLEERNVLALKYKDEGNVLFKGDNYAQARAKYTLGLRICPLAKEKERAVLFANRAACSMKEGRKKEAIEDCSLALQLDPLYLKALKRRAALYEMDEKFDESLEDYKKIVEMDRTDKIAFEALQRLPDKINERNEKLKTQMLGTLKDLGNKILSPFGLSTDNFQLQQDPNSGGYSINFNQNKS